jgi:hypothetical protein
LEAPTCPQNPFADGDARKKNANHENTKGRKHESEKLVSLPRISCPRFVLSSFRVFVIRIVRAPRPRRAVRIFISAREKL